MSTIQVVINWQARYIAYDQCSPEIFRVGQVVEVQLVSLVSSFSKGIRSLYLLSER